MDKYEKLGTFIGIMIMIIWFLGGIYLTIDTLTYWWNHDFLTMMQIFKVVIQRHIILLSVMIISYIFILYAKIKS